MYIHVVIIVSTLRVCQGIYTPVDDYGMVIKVIADNFLSLLHQRNLYDIKNVIVSLFLTFHFWYCI